MTFPGHIVKKGAQGAEVLTIAQRLVALGYEADGTQNKFDARLASVVKLFQSQHSSSDGRPLLEDGEVGPLTWGALFRQLSP